jgi:hypothetical protein
MRALPRQANPFPHPRKIRDSRNEVYRRAHLISVGHRTQGTAHLISSDQLVVRSRGDALPFGRATASEPTFWSRH